MKNIVQMIINCFFSKYTFVILALAATFAFSACHQKNNETHKKATTSKQVTTKKVKKPTRKKLVPLTNANLVKELTTYGAENPETMVLLKTPKGNMKIKLYENTPLHRANFIRLIKNNFYKETMFYRVINNFMIQGGDNDDWSRSTIKNKMGDYTIPAEFRKENIHKKGALSMVREYEGNPEKRSISFEWFIVQGKKYTDGELNAIEQEYGQKILAEHRAYYKELGGTPHLNGQHTVFGQVIEGIDVIDSIAAVKVDEGNWPIDDMTIELEIIK